MSTVGGSLKAKIRRLWERKAWMFIDSMNWWQHCGSRRRSRVHYRRDNWIDPPPSPPRWLVSCFSLWVNVNLTHFVVYWESEVVYLETSGGGGQNAPYSGFNRDCDKYKCPPHQGRWVESITSTVAGCVRLAARCLSPLPSSQLLVFVPTFPFYHLSLSHFISHTFPLVFNPSPSLPLQPLWASK